MKESYYVTIVVLITVVVLTGLFFYNQGLSQKITGTLPLTENASFTFEKVLTKPAESSRYYVIFYGNLSNNSSRLENLGQETPVDPCSSYRNKLSSTQRDFEYDCRMMNGPSYAVSPSYYSSLEERCRKLQDEELDQKTQLDQCMSSQEYQEYQIQSANYERLIKEGYYKLRLKTPKGELCDLDPFYKLNNRYPNLGSKFSGYGSLQPNEKKIGSLVFKCSERQGTFTIQFRDSSLEINI